MPSTSTSIIWASKPCGYILGQAANLPSTSMSPTNETSSLKVKRLGLRQLENEKPNVQLTRRCQRQLLQLDLEPTDVGKDIAAARWILQEWFFGWVQQRTWLCIQSQGLCRSPHSWHLEATQGSVARCATLYFESQICLGNSSAAAICWAKAFCTGCQVLQVLSTDCVAFRFSLSRR